MLIMAARKIPVERIETAERRAQRLINCRVVGEIKTLGVAKAYGTVVSSHSAFPMVSIKLRASEHWSKLTKNVDSGERSQSSWHCEICNGTDRKLSERTALP